MSPLFGFGAACREPFRTGVDDVSGCRGYGRGAPARGHVHGGAPPAVGGLLGAVPGSGADVTLRSWSRSAGVPSASRKCFRPADGAAHGTARCTVGAVAPRCLCRWGRPAELPLAPYRRGSSHPPCGWRPATKCTATVCSRSRRGRGPCEALERSGGVRFAGAAMRAVVCSAGGRVPAVCTARSSVSPSRRSPWAVRSVPGGRLAGRVSGEIL